MTSIIDKSTVFEGTHVPRAVPVETSDVVFAIPYDLPQPEPIVVQETLKHEHSSCKFPFWVPCFLCSFALFTCPPNKADCCNMVCCSCTCKCCDCCDSRSNNTYCYVNANGSNNDTCCCCCDCSGCDLNCCCFCCEACAGCG
jgi:hypothetical protein